MSVLEEYFRELREIRSSGAGVPETSYYPALSNLLNDVGKSLKPRVRCIFQLANRGAGQPDGGLFTSEQLRRPDNSKPLLGQSPNRGVIEVKATSDNAWVTAEGPQVSRYWDKYQQVLVTNYRDFVLVGQDEAGNPVKLETYSLAHNEAEFWSKATHPHTFAAEHEVSFIEYLHRVMLHGSPINSPQEVAWFLASYARTAKARVEAQELPALASLRAALEEALGLKFEGARGNHFFRSTLVQTLFYGIFSAWVLCCKERPLGSKETFNWHEAAWTLHVPMIQGLFHQIATPQRLRPLGLVEVLDWTGAVLNRVDRASFFAQFDQGPAIQYFYEPFLAAFHPQLRKDLGVWFTPPEIVRYMVERVDSVLREELDLPDGLADPNVYVLDPCAGTGSYLVEVLRRIATTLKVNGGDALVAQDLKKAATDRVFGFEILPAPFVVAHLQLGLLLQGFGAPLDADSQERAGVYLTNALTGWKPLDPEKEQAFQAILTGFPELLEERDNAQEVKQNVPILVILGNPPYNGFAGRSPAAEQGLVEPYKEGLEKWDITKNYLDDLYVRFFRVAERRIAEQTNQGVVCYISNFSYLSDPSFVVMRQRFLSEFDKLWFDRMNGDSRETGKRTPEGKPDPSVFSTEYNKAGIRVGTTVSLMVRKGKRDEQPSVSFRQFWGVTKRADLLEGLESPELNTQYQPICPTADNWYSFCPETLTAEYRNWPLLTSICEIEPMLGLNENRRGALQDTIKETLQSRMQSYYDASVSIDQIRAIHSGLATNAASFDAQASRERLLKESAFNKSNTFPFWFKPFDCRWAYVESIGNLWNRTRPLLLNQAWSGNTFLLARRHAPNVDDGSAMFFSHHIADQHVLQTDAYFFPIRVLPPGDNRKATGPQSSFLGEIETRTNPTANLSGAARFYLAGLGILNPDDDAETASLVWMHALAIGYSPAYLLENADGIRQDWPRVPLPATRVALESSASLGKQVTDLLDTEHIGPGITSGSIRSELRRVGVVSREGGGSLQTGELAVTAGWGHAGQNNVVMPGKGKLMERDFTQEELAAIQTGAEELGLSLEDALAQLGEHTYDVYLNAGAYWCNVPKGVWDYVIGGSKVAYVPSFSAGMVLL